MPKTNERRLCANGCLAFKKYLADLTTKEQKGEIMFIILKLLALCLYGIFVGLIAKLLHPSPNPTGLLSTIITGVCGTYIGGLINYLLGWGELLSSSGIIMSVLGGIIFLAAYRWWDLKKQKRSFWTGRNLM